MRSTQFSFVVIMPVYEDLEACTRLFGELSSQTNGRAMVVAVDDGSVRQPLQASYLEDAGISGVVLRLRRNVGHQKAIAIGLGYVSELLDLKQNVVVMDSDGEDRPETIPLLLQKLASGTADIVVAQRRSRVETLKFKFFYTIYKWLFHLVTGHEISFGNFMAMRPAAVRRMASMSELPIHVASAVLVSKLRVEKCPLDRGARYAGKSKMNFVGLALHGLRGVMVFAEDVLVRAGIASAIVASLAIAAALVAVLLKFVGFSTPGWFSTMLGILLLIVLQTGSLALMTLMLSGVVRSGNIALAPSYRDFILEVMKTKAKKSR
jgi:polyisoprenyl-phosphate glycosyltransferase